MGWGYYEFRPYVSVAQRRAKAAKYAEKLAKREKRTLSPVEIDGRAIARSFWGKAWCDHLEGHSDFENRLPRGRTYVRNGSVIDLQIERGKVTALVSGSDIYKVNVTIKTLAKSAWNKIKQECAQSIDSLLDLLQGRFDEGIMRRLTDLDSGLFPKPREIEMTCSCPDYARLCKHVAAVLYGVGARLDTAPEMLFTLRDVDHQELVGQAMASGNLDRNLGTSKSDALAGSDLGELFGIEIDTVPAATSSGTAEAANPKKRRTRGKITRVAAKPVAQLAAKPRRKPIKGRKPDAKRSKATRQTSAARRVIPVKTPVIVRSRKHRDPETKT